MADEAPMESTAQPGSMQVMVDERDVKTHYSNAYRMFSLADEVVVDLGFNMPDSSGRGGQQPAMVLKVTDRIIMNYMNAKRLANSLTQLVKRYEQQFGEIPSPQSRQMMK